MARAHVSRGSATRRRTPWGWLLLLGFRSRAGCLHRQPAYDLLHTLRLLRIVERGGNFRIAVHRAAQCDYAFIGVDTNLASGERWVRADSGLHVAGDLRISALCARNISRLRAAAQG